MKRDYTNGTYETLTFKEYLNNLDFKNNFVILRREANLIIAI